MCPESRLPLPKRAAVADRSAIPGVPHPTAAARLGGIDVPGTPGRLLTLPTPDVLDLDLVGLDQRLERGVVEGFGCDLARPTRPEVQPLATGKRNAERTLRLVPDLHRVENPTRKHGPRTPPTTTTTRCGRAPETCKPFTYRALSDTATASHGRPPAMPPLPTHDMIPTAAGHLRDVLDLALEYDPSHSALVVWDGNSELSRTLSEAYRLCLPTARFMDFDSAGPATIRQSLEQLEAEDLVVLIQSTSFRLDAFRIRIELFRRGLKVIEHPHLARMRGEEGRTYINSLAYDRDYFHGVGHSLKMRIDKAQVCVIDSGGVQLTFPAAFEPAKINIGDYTGMQNIGGQFPIGEVFTESRELEAVRGRVRIALFGDTSFTVNRPDHPITLVVEQGRVVKAVDSTPEFDRVLASIRADDGEVWLRELGLGMNRAFTHEKIVSDIGSFERMCGVHLSLGSKHTIFNKPEIRKKTARHHVDVFVATEVVRLDDDVIYRAGAWVV